MDTELIKLSARALNNAEKVWISKHIKNTDRAVGAMLSGEITRKFGSSELQNDTVNARFYGSAGQSFGAFLVTGVSFTLEGDANDYLGKGLSGGKIVVTPPEGSTFRPEE
jgi:glutamate synthase (NADPH) large chain